MIVLAVVFEPSVSSYVYPRRHLCRVLGKTLVIFTLAGLNYLTPFHIF